MWEIISTATGLTYGHTKSLEDARKHVFGGGFFARCGTLFLLRNPSDGRVVPAKY